MGGTDGGTDAFINAALSYPTAPLTALLGVVLVYWLLALIGLVDFESSGLDLDVDVQADADPGDISTLASYLVAWGLGGVPLSVSVSFIVLVGWTLTSLASMWLLPLMPSALQSPLEGTVALLVSLSAAVIVTAQIVRPLRKLFVTHTALANADLVGQPCTVITGSVDAQVGRAEVKQRGVAINIRVWASTPNTLCRGSPARIAEYDASKARYRIEPSIEPEV